MTVRGLSPGTDIATELATDIANAFKYKAKQLGADVSVENLLDFHGYVQGTIADALGRCSADIGEPIAWLDVRTAGLDWQSRLVATNPQYVENNGPENFVPLYAGVAQQEQEPLERECFDMLWQWFTERRGAEDMRANATNGGLSAADFKQMLDEHESNLLEEIKS